MLSYLAVIIGTQSSNAIEPVKTKTLFSPEYCSCCGKETLYLVRVDNGTDVRSHDYVYRTPCCLAETLDYDPQAAIEDDGKE